ncbi:MAG: excisionase family DNA-binding protein [Nitrospira sp.]|nr:excisionase family DNA-binding protein [Nitrospira sp.]
MDYQSTQKLRFISVVEMAGILGASKYTLYRRIKEGKIPALFLGRKVLLNPEEVLTSLQNSKHQAVRREVNI